jgi:hypothetical protein
MSGNSNGPQLRAAPLITSAAMIGAGTLVALAGLAIGRRVGLAERVASQRDQRLLTCDYWH